MRFLVVDPNWTKHNAIQIWPAVFTGLSCFAISMPVSCHCRGSPFVHLCFEKCKYFMCLLVVMLPRTRLLHTLGSRETVTFLCWKLKKIIVIHGNGRRFFWNWFLPSTQIFRFTVHWTTDGTYEAHARNNQEAGNSGIACGGEVLKMQHGSNLDTSETRSGFYARYFNLIWS